MEVTLAPTPKVSLVSQIHHPPNFITELGFMKIPKVATFVSIDQG